MRTLAATWIIIGGPTAAWIVGTNWEHIEQFAVLATCAAVWLLPVGWLYHHADNHDRKV